MPLLHDLKYKIPFFARNPTKILWLELRRKYNSYKYIEKAERVSLGKNFRYDRTQPYYASIGYNSHVDSHNIWNSDTGNISVGSSCWIGLHNILMGPLRIGDNFSTGPHVKILGPRHAAFQYENQDRSETIIGNNVAITTGAILLYGVHIGDNAIIGPGSVVNKDVKAGAYVFGTPARDLTNLVNFDHTSVSTQNTNSKIK